MKFFSPPTRRALDRNPPDFLQAARAVDTAVLGDPVEVLQDGVSGALIRARSDPLFDPLEVEGPAAVDEIDEGLRSLLRAAHDNRVFPIEGALDRVELDAILGFDLIEDLLDRGLVGSIEPIPQPIADFLDRLVSGVVPSFFHSRDVDPLVVAVDPRVEGVEAEGAGEELVREGGGHCSLRVGGWDDPLPTLVYYSGCRKREGTG